MSVGPMTTGSTSSGVGPAGRVAVVIPTYNCERYIGSTLESVRAQTFADWHLLVYDDGSADDTVGVVQQFVDADRRVTLVRGQNAGVATARNKGLEAAGNESEYVIFLDHDDLWVPEALETLVGVLDAHPQYTSVHSLARCIDAAGELVADDGLEADMRNRRAYQDGRVVTLGPGEPTTFAAMTFHNWIITPGTFLVRREVMQRIGGFDADTTPADDWDIAVRVSRVGDIGWVDQPLLLWRRHDQAQSYHSPNYGRAHLRVRRKMLTDPTNSPSQARSARQAFTSGARSDIGLALQHVRRGAFRAATRDVARALRQYGSYVAARVSMRR